MVTTVQGAYQACHQIMLLAPGYTPRENDGVSYVLLQVSDSGEDIQIAGYIVDPGIPDQGNNEDFKKLGVEQQIAVLLVPILSKLTQKLADKVTGNSSSMNSIKELLRKVTHD